MSLDAFRRAVQDNPQDATEVARALARPSSDPVISATVVAANGEELVLVFEGGRWRIDATAVDLYGQATPRQALMGFLRAFERKRYDVILRYVPDADREGAMGFAEEPPIAEPPAAKDAAKPPAKDAAKPPAKPAAGAARAPLTAQKIREAWEGPQKEQITRIVQAIRSAIPTARIEETGDSAAMAYGEGASVAFIREHGAWKIKDF